MGEAILSGVSLGICAILMFGIGAFQIKSKKPVGFYTGETAPDEKELSDVTAWNRKHGMMFILYGFGLVLAWVCGLIIGDSPLLLIPFAVCLLLPIPLMIFYHHKLVRKYSIGQKADRKPIPPTDRKENGDLHEIQRTDL